MTGYIIRRIVQGLIVLLIVTFIVFVAMRLLPGDPLVLFVSQDELMEMGDELIEKLRAEYGIDKPILVQYVNWIWGLFHGDMGKSIFTGEMVSTQIAKKLPVTFHLASLSLIISAILGIFFGLTCALRRGKPIDTFFTVLANIGITVPSFWVGILLIYFLSLKLNLLPTYGYTSPFSDPWLSFKQLIMPVFCLSLFAIAALTRQTRSSMLEVIQHDYVRTAWAKGLREGLIISRHVLKNALIPVVTILGMQVNIMFGGSVIIEAVFNIPGMGTLMRDALFGHDYQVVQGIIIVIASVVVLVNFLVDISYGWLDPRIRYE